MKTLHILTLIVNLSSTFQAAFNAPLKLFQGIAQRLCAARGHWGLITASAVNGQVVYRTETSILETRATITPKGDYLLMFPEGDHYAKSKSENINAKMACSSSDHCKTWTKPEPSTPVHPDVPPMLFPLPDGKTLVAFHHNKVPTTGNGELSDKAELMKMRSEVWASISTVEGHTWSVPRFVLAGYRRGFLGDGLLLCST